VTINTKIFITIGSFSRNERVVLIIAVETREHKAYGIVHKDAYGCLTEKQEWT
jgi:hypothetical protein